MLGVIVMALASSWAGMSHSAQRKKEQKEVYTRPRPTRPIRPQIPGANRFIQDKVFLENADSLYRPANEYEEYQIVKGSVKFRQGNMWMMCDSAYYYPEKNSMDAFGHVEMHQGDTLFVYSDRLYYDGFEKHATLVRGASRNKVELRNKTVTLTTDSLDYDVAGERGWYTTGGVLDDKVNTLTSQYGEYSPSTKLAQFRTDVLLVNNKDGYRMLTDELDYNTRTHIATINTHTVIEGANDTIITTQGWYDTRTDHAQLTSRSTITHRDSAKNVTWLEGDSIIYDKQSRLSRAYMFRDPAKVQQPMVITDTARKVQLIGGYGEYNDSTRRAMATEYPLLIEYSRPDTLFLRADTVLSLMEGRMVWPDSLAGNLDAAARRRLSNVTDILQLVEGMEVIPMVRPNDVKKPGWGIAEYSQLTESGNGRSEGGSLPADSVAVPKRRLDSLGRDSLNMIPRDFHLAKAIGKARFFNTDVQGVADTMIFRQYDSLLYLLRKPVVWSGERQVMGNRIEVHLNDSTADWAYLPESGMVAEHIDENFYNQMSGSRMKAWLENQKIKRLEVDGNVQTVFMPQDKDSTYSKLVNAESSFLTVEFDGGKVKHLRMWPEVSGNVTPVGKVRNDMKYLPGFRWLEAMRPRRQWYGDRVRWIDELGEIPDEVLEWFK